RVDLMKEHADEIAALESLDAGKPIAGVLRQDLPAAIDTLTYYAGWADKISGEVVSTRDDALTYTVREPVGVVAAIVPWNFPLMIGMRSEEHTSELQSHLKLVCRLLLEKKNEEKWLNMLGTLVKDC